MAGNSRARLLTLILLMVWLVPATPAETSDDVDLVGVSADLIKQGRDGDAVAMLEPQALRGDPRAQYLLGSMLLTSRSIPQDRPRGFAWLQLATSGVDRLGDDWATPRALTMITKVGPTMSGPELLEADRLLGELREQVVASKTRRYADSLAFYTNARVASISNGVEFVEPVVKINVPQKAWQQPPGRLGCASPSATRCLGAEFDAATPRCTGVISNPDQYASMLGEQTKFAGPRLDFLKLKSQAPDRIFLLAHVDASGWICSVILARGSGDYHIDGPMLDVVRRWRLSPAQKDGKPVESLYFVIVNMKVKGPGSHE